MAVVVIAFIVFMERAQRRLLIKYPKRQVGNRMFERRDLVPAAEAQHLGRDPADLRLVAAAAAGDGRRASWRTGDLPAFLAAAGRGLARRTAGRCSWSLYAALIIFFCFFYTSIVFNPEETAENLQEVRRLPAGHPARQADGRVSSTTC